MTALSTVVGGLHVPLTECDWILRAPCGCARSVCRAMCAGFVLPTEDAAWHEFHEDAGPKRKRDAAIKAAIKAGFTVELDTVHNAVVAFKAPCTHREPASAGALFDPIDPCQE